MFRRTSLVLIALLITALLVAACQRDTAETTTAPAVEATSAPVEEAAAAPAEAATAAPAQEEPAENEPAEEATVVVLEEGAAEEAARADATTFTIVPDGTEARFYLDEVLLGNDVTVVGVTSLVEGEVTVDPANPAASTVGTITIDARDLTTDNDRRNSAIQRFVLQSADDANRYITFTPTSIDGLPESVTVGQAFSFSVTGDLQIRDVVNSETFMMTVTPISETELTGTGQATIERADYNLTIPSVPSVANVSEAVILELDFVARP